MFTAASFSVHQIPADATNSPYFNACAPDTLSTNPHVVIPVVEVGLVVDRLRPLDSYGYFLGGGRVRHRLGSPYRDVFAARASSSEAESHIGGGG